VVDRVLSKDRAERYASASEFVNALSLALGSVHEAGTATRNAWPPRDQPATSVATLPDTASEAVLVLNPPVPMRVGLLIAALACGILGFIALRYWASVDARAEPPSAADLSRQVLAQATLPTIEQNIQPSIEPSANMAAPRATTTGAALSVSRSTRREPLSVRAEAPLTQPAAVPVASALLPDTAAPPPAATLPAPRAVGSGPSARGYVLDSPY
jgi:hypothetical protein